MDTKEEIKKQVIEDLKNNPKLSSRVLGEKYHVDPKVVKCWKAHVTMRSYDVDHPRKKLITDGKALIKRIRSGEDIHLVKEEAVSVIAGLGIRYPTTTYKKVIKKFNTEVIDGQVLVSAQSFFNRLMELKNPKLEKESNIEVTHNRIEVQLDPEAKKLYLKLSKKRGMSLNAFLSMTLNKKAKDYLKKVEEEMAHLQDKAIENLGIDDL